MNQKTSAKASAKKKPTFLRRTIKRYIKLGGKRKKLWRKPTGRDNKMREKRRGYPKTVSIGYGSQKTLRWKINGRNPVVIYNLKDLEGIKEDEIVVVGRVGKKKKIELVKKAEELKIKLGNLNSRKILRKIKRKEKPNTDKKEKKK